MKIALIGQSLFGQEVYKELKKDGHMIVGVFTIPDKDGKVDPLDDGLDTGPILLQRECDVEPNENVNSIYKRILFPEGVIVMVEAVKLIAAGTAPRIKQQEEGATYECIQKKENSKSVKQLMPHATCSASSQQTSDKQSYKQIEVSEYENEELLYFFS
ncbi:mitochondrial 10-formyltetrahydrofolate dehydrogenase-like isoform X2 [Carassius auratus]|uniref:Mitochondrial 10-formyltetrahydrofolate dehydrogenase-like isoform X2 n=1 Tax=Carassius auratus TaxID=7957 RepID=A0A6P6PDZ9_CARAU|nr:mitochondrial 10-formyltetrahydrofolate dehydrogenase-like isoform X2 [Carassius auratus]